MPRTGRALSQVEERRPDGEHDGDLTDLDADVEGDQRDEEMWRVEIEHVRENEGKAEAMQEADAHGDGNCRGARLRVRDLMEDEVMDAVGTRVTAVITEQPAELAGILRDDLIVAVGERPIRKASDLITAIALHRVGDKVAVALRRNEQDLVVDLTLSR